MTTYNYDDDDDDDQLHIIKYNLKLYLLTHFIFMHDLLS